VSDAAKLLVPAIRWDPQSGFDAARPLVERALKLGCGGYIFFGGEVRAVRALTQELRERSQFPLLIASDLERGAGQQFVGATGLPPLAAIGASKEQGVLARAARLTAREALALGVNWVLAPVCDVDLEPNNPIIGTRALGSDAGVVSILASEWIDACQSAGALACAKHFPGHGRTTVDSHAVLPTVEADRHELAEFDLAPFRAAIEAGVASILTAHIAFPALDATGTPATLSRKILHGLLRRELLFDGIVVTDAMIMEGVLQGRSESTACVSALAAGCDLVLYPADLDAVEGAVRAAIQSGDLVRDEVLKSLERREKWASWAGSALTPHTGGEEEWARQLALSSVAEVRGQVAGISGKLDLFLVDDDLGGPYPAPSREFLVDALLAHGVEARWVDETSRGAASSGGASDKSVIVALFGDVRSWKGRVGYSGASLEAVARVLAREPDAIILQFSHPRLALSLPPAVATVVSAWGGERTMQEAAAAWLSQRAAGAGQ
jgi:beta-glucosidase